MEGGYTNVNQMFTSAIGSSAVTGEKFNFLEGGGDYITKGGISYIRVRMGMNKLH